MAEPFDIVNDLAAAAGVRPTPAFRLRVYWNAAVRFGFERLAWWSPTAGLRYFFYSRMGMVIGPDVFLGSEILFDKSFPERIQIGACAAIGDRCLIFAHANIPSPSDLRARYPLTVKDTVIEEHVWIMPGCTVAPGVRIGHHSVIATGAIVYRDVPPYSLVTASPMRVSPLDPPPA